MWAHQPDIQRDPDHDEPRGVADEYHASEFGAIRSIGTRWQAFVNRTDHGYAVVWWDPQALVLGDQAGFGLAS